MNALSNPLAAPASPLALLVDGENLRPDLAATLLARSRAYGDPLIRRVYGDASRLPGWDALPGFRLIHSGRGKNAADMLLCIEAMALVQAGRASVVAIASSDGDFGHLATHLRESGIVVIGMGEAKSPAHWRQACSHFTQIGPASALPTKPAPPKPQPPKTAEDKALDQITALLRQEAPDGTLPLTRIGQALPGVLAQTGHATWSKLLRAHPARFCLDLASCSGGAVRLN